MNTDRSGLPETGDRPAAPAGPAGHVVFAALSAGPIGLPEALLAVESPQCGAVVGFSGVVRDHDGGRTVSALSYSAHPSAEQVFSAVLARVAQEFPGTRLWAQHRVGELQIGDPALVCAVAAAHRGLAFAACSALVDRIKAEVPIWKEQFFADGGVEWVGAGPAADSVPPQPSQ
ncbi:molybdenum cofactor biosynthesis protein MoaE [Arthrobacter russicus]|uniref:Molybdopterin synthase catalytic subunit n=1 Tax=Arthrobacter russicus TaxID=172040 RepID=A0ABU1JF65_9MICC|nr:molybdenum cofactor biosynthesis protein MoaE [Arthrobacter russicus]MDN5670254.1 molybdenum cofactor biosynthesis protein MoaE [Renibacterium salmoninarum]MDR6270764.1 molybdopterin synthase catalytic subunit [Arthrobacter russicus]